MPAHYVLTGAAEFKTLLKTYLSTKGKCTLIADANGAVPVSA